MEDATGVHVIVHGTVQGVFFRLATQREARRHGVRGWVRNLSDGTVEALFEGAPPAVDRLLRWCEKGPPAAVVQRVAITPRPCSGRCSDFQVLA